MSPLFFCPQLNRYSKNRLKNHARSIPKDLGEANSTNYYRDFIAPPHEKSHVQALSVWVMDVLMDSEINIFIFPEKKRSLVQKGLLYFNVTATFTWARSLNIFPSPWLPRGFFFFQMVSENAEKWVKYHRNYRMKEEVHQDQRVGKLL